MGKGIAKTTALIAGGGMAGMCCAIMLAQNGIAVTLLERQERVGRKLLLTGSGKCNISNTDISASHYICDDADKLDRILRRFDNEKAERFLNGLGIALCERKGCIYPVTRQASTVLDVLRLRMEELGVHVLTGKYVRKAEEDRKGRCFVCADESRIYGDKLIFACGGLAGIYDEERSNGYDVLKQLGHRLVRTAPGLVQIKVSEELKSIAGIRCDAGVKLTCDGKTVAEDMGELQITADALSGIPVFQLSRFIEAKKEYELRTDVLPFINDTADLRERYAGCRNRSLEEAFYGLLNKKLAVYMIKKAGYRPDTPLKNMREAEFEKLVKTIKEMSFTVSGTKGYKNAQISMGGISLNDVDDNCESLLCKDIYILGEMLNACGECGGYNLHFAMASAACAARGITGKNVQD